jgi:hypothetical protein
MLLDRRLAPRDRRGAPRVALVCGVRNTQSDARVLLCLARNISLHGMEILRVRDAPLAPATPVTLEFELPDGAEVIRAEGVVVFDREGARTGQVGVRFRALAPEDAERIDAYVQRAT